MRVGPLVAIAFVVALPGSSVFADDGGIENVGGAARLLDDQGRVRMVREVVHARVTDDSVDVDCEFEFLNSGPADTVLMGFPDRGDGDADGGAPMTTFRSWVDGVEVPCVLIPDAEHSKPGDEERRGWWTHSVFFAEGQRRIIHDHYRAICGGTVDGYRSFEYILETGASWAGSIGDAEIVVTLVGLSPRWISTVSPRPVTRGRELTWRFHDFEPGRDGSPATIDLSWRTPAARARWESLNRGSR